MNTDKTRKDGEGFRTRTLADLFARFTVRVIPSHNSRVDNPFLMSLSVFICVHPWLPSALSSSVFICVHQWMQSHLSRVQPSAIYIHDMQASILESTRCEH